MRERGGGGGGGGGLGGGLGGRRGRAGRRREEGDQEKVGAGAECVIVGRQGGLMQKKKILA